MDHAGTIKITTGKFSWTEYIFPCHSLPDHVWLFAHDKRTQVWPVLRHYNRILQILPHLIKQVNRMTRPGIFFSEQANCRMCFPGPFSAGHALPCRWNCPCISVQDIREGMAKSRQRLHCHAYLVRIC